MKNGNMLLLKPRKPVDFIALDAQKEQLLLENAALKEGLSSVQRKVWFYDFFFFFF